MSGLWAPQDCSARSVFSEILCTFEGHHTNEAEPLEHHSAIGHFPKMGELIKDILSSGVKTEGLRKQWLIKKLHLIKKLQPACKCFRKARYSNE